MKKNIFLLAIFLILSACSSVPSTDFYSIDIKPRQATYFSKKVGGTLLIKDISVKGLLVGQGIVFRQEGSKNKMILEEHFWSEPLETTFTNAITKYLEDNQIFDEIITDSNGQTPDYELYANIDNLEMTYRADDVVSADISIKFMIKKKNGEIMFLDRYYKSANISDDDISLFAGRIEYLLNRILSEFVEDVKGRIS